MMITQEPDGFKPWEQPDDDFDENWPYCQCDCEPDEEESGGNICKGCGKLLT